MEKQRMGILNTKKNVYPHHSDVTWHQYVTWISEGGGDEWFQEKTLNLLQGSEPDVQIDNRKDSSEHHNT